MIRLLPASESGAFAAISLASSSARPSSSAGSTTSFDEAHRARPLGVDVAPTKKSSAVSATPQTSMNLRRPVCE